MIDGKVVAHHPFLSNEAQLRLAAARDRRDADYADAIVDRRPIRSARTRAIPDSPRSAGVASLIYPEPEMIRRAAAKAMDPINQRLSLIVPPTAVGGTCDPLRAAIIRLMPHDHSRGVHLQVQNDLRVEDWRAKVKTQRAAEAPAWTRGHVAKESMASRCVPFPFFPADHAGFCDRTAKSRMWTRNGVECSSETRAFVVMKHGSRFSITLSHPGRAALPPILPPSFASTQPPGNAI